MARQVFGAVAKAETDITALIQRDPGSRGPDRHHQGDRFYRRLSGSAHDSGQRGSHETANSRLVPHRDAVAAHEADGQQVCRPMTLTG